MDGLPAAERRGSKVRNATKIGAREGPKKVNPKLSEASGNVTAETLRPEQEAERLNDRGR